MTSNQTTGIKTNTIRDMMLYDALPEYIRNIISNQNDNFDVEGIARFYVDLKKRNPSKQYISYEIRQLLRRSS